jgi:K+-transporting ATPase ATPase C chain
MNAFLSHLRAAVLGTLVLAVVTCGAYPLVVWGISQAIFSDKADGSLIVGKDGTVRGSRLIGQGFTGATYFHPRPSAAGANGYDAASSGGSNLGLTSRKLADAIKDRVAAYRAENGLKETDTVPADAVTASASGLDPHISPRNAEFQAPRIAKARGLAVEKVLAQVHAHTDPAGFGFLGEPGVNVLRLNLALDEP